MDRRSALLKHPVYRRPDASAGETVVTSPSAAHKLRNTRSAGDHKTLPSRLQLAALSGRPKTPTLAVPALELPDPRSSRRPALDPILDAAFRLQQRRALDPRLQAQGLPHGQGRANGVTDSSAESTRLTGGMGVASASARFLSRLTGRGLPSVKSHSDGVDAAVNNSSLSKSSAWVEPDVGADTPVAAKPDVVSIGRASLEQLMKRLEALEQRTATGSAQIPPRQVDQVHRQGVVGTSAALPPTFEQQLQEQLRQQELRYHKQLLEQQEMQQKLQQQLLEQQNLILRQSPQNRSMSPERASRKRNLDPSRVRHRRRRKHPKKKHRRKRKDKHRSHRRSSNSSSSLSSSLSSDLRSDSDSFNSSDSSGDASRKDTRKSKGRHRGHGPNAKASKTSSPTKGAPHAGRKSTSPMKKLVGMAAALATQGRKSPKRRSELGSSPNVTVDQKIALLDDQIQLETQVGYIAEILIDEFLRFSIIPDLLIEAISMSNVDELPQNEVEARAIFAELLDEVMEEILRKVLVKQMDDMVQEMLVKRQVQTLKPPLHMVFDDLMEETVDSLAPQIADLAMEEMIDEYFFEQRVLKFVYSIVDERSAQIAHEVYNGGMTAGILEDEIIAVVVDALARDVASECAAEAEEEASQYREEREHTSVVESTERFMLRAMLRKLVQTVATRGEPLVLRNETRLVMQRNLVQSLIGRVAQLEAPVDDLQENAAHRWFQNRINGSVAFHCMLHQALGRQLDAEEARIDALEASRHRHNPILPGCHSRESSNKSQALGAQEALPAAIALNTRRSE